MRLGAAPLCPLRPPPKKKKQLLPFLATLMAPGGDRAEETPPGWDTLCQRGGSQRGGTTETWGSLGVLWGSCGMLRGAMGCCGGAMGCCGVHWGPEGVPRGPKGS